MVGICGVIVTSESCHLDVIVMSSSCDFLVIFVVFYTLVVEPVDCNGWDFEYSKEEHHKTYKEYTESIQRA